MKMTPPSSGKRSRIPKANLEWVSWMGPAFISNFENVKSEGILKDEMEDMSQKV